MPTSVELTEQELDELKAYTKESDASAAIRLAMTEYLRFARRMELKMASGQVQMEENWQSLESLELRDRDGGARPGVG